MTLYIFKKMLSSSIRKLSIFCFLLFTVALHSQQGHGPFDKIPLNPNFAEEMQRTTTFKSEKHQPDFERIEHIRLLLKALLRGVLFTNRFITKNKNTLQNKNQDPDQNRKEVVLYVDNLLRVLKQSPEEIEKFIQDYNFTKSDKKLIFLYILFNYDPGESIFELMQILDLSVNDTLTFKDINDPLIEKDLKDSDEAIAVLSHLLAGTGDPKIVKRLLGTDYDSNIKNYLEENILHTFIRLHINRRNDTLPINPDYKEAFNLLAEHSQQIINERNIVGHSPYDVAINHYDDFIVKTLRNKRAEWILSGDKKNRQKKANRPVSYFTFEPFVTSFIRIIQMTNPEMSQESLGKLYSRFLIAFNQAESSRLKILTKAFFHSDTTTQTARNIALILTAIIDRDSHFFTNITDAQKKSLDHKFLYSVDKHPSLFVTNLLLEAIRHSFLPAVEYILKNYEESELGPKDLPSFSLDPLSLSLLTYASLDMNHSLKPEARKIIRIVANYTDVKKNYHFFINIPPISWAVLFGLVDEVKFLHEEKKADLIPDIYNSNQGWQFNILDYTRTMGFLNLNSYLKSKITESSICKNPFLQ